MVTLSRTTAPAVVPEQREQLQGSPISTVQTGGQQFGQQAYFIENVGQFDYPGVRYYLQTPHLEAGFAEGRVYFNMLRWEQVGDDRADPVFQQVGGHLFTLELANQQATPSASDPLPSYSNYLHADPARSFARVHHFEGIQYEDVYPGIDLVYFVNSQNELTYEFIVSPGADPAQIKLRYQAIAGIELTDEGKPIIVTSAGPLMESRLVTYQEDNGERQVIASTFAPTGNNSYGFTFPGDYDETLPLIIDPTLTFATYWGTPTGGTHRSVVFDAAGNIYASGGTNQPNWPTTLGAYDRTFGGGNWGDIVAAKFNPNGTVVWSTYIGGSGEDIAYVSAVDPDTGELYLSGRAGGGPNPGDERGFPTTPGAFDTTFNGGVGSGGVHGPTDAYVLKLSADGSRLIYSTYIGGSGDENGRAIHLFPNGEVVVGETTSSTNLPTTAGVVKPTFSGSRDGWIARLSADGSLLRFLTYMGPNDDPLGDETIRALAADNQGNIWFAGTTNGTSWSPLAITSNALQPVHGGGINETYIGKLAPDGKTLLYLSWFGGSGFEEVETEGVSDSAGNFYIAGATSSPDFPTTSGAFQRQVRGTGGQFYYGDAWVARINADGTLGASTLLGGSTVGYEVLFGPAVDSRGNIYAFGYMVSPNLATPGAYQGSLNAASDGFLAIFSPDAKNLRYGTYLGGSGEEIGRFIGIALNGTAVGVGGETTSTDFPILNAAQTAPGSAFLARFDTTDINPPPNQAPYVPHTPIPADWSTAVPVSQILSWKGGDPDGDVVTYTVAFGLTNPPPVVTTTSSTSFAPSLLMDTKFYWAITASDGFSTSAGPVWRFTTTGPPAIFIQDVTVTEGNSGSVSAVFSANLTAASSTRITVDYATADNTATAPADYTSVPTSTLIFAPGAVTRSIVVPVHGDTLTEGTETFFVNLRQPTNATLADDQGLGTISDDDVFPPGIFHFAAHAYNPTEHDGTITIAISRTGGTQGNVTVSYQTVAGTASSGIDYGTASGTLSFANGISSRTFNVLIYDDLLTEGDETVTLRLTNPTGGAILGSQSEVLLTIIDDDTYKIRFPFIWR